jgi:hypothetical protein
VGDIETEASERDLIEEVLHGGDRLTNGFARVHVFECDFVAKEVKDAEAAADGVGMNDDTGGERGQGEKRVGNGE